MPRDKRVFVEVTEIEGLSSTCSASSALKGALVQDSGHTWLYFCSRVMVTGTPATLDLSPGYLAIPRLAITTLVLVNAFAFFLVWL